MYDYNLPTLKPPLIHSSKCNIALCLYGLPASTDKFIKKPSQSKRILNESLNNYVRRFKNFNNLDIFIHTWQTDLSQYYIELFKPLKFKIEQYPFPPYITWQKSLGNKFLPSFFYKHLTMKLVVDLCRNYELQRNKQYNLIILTRPDVYWHIDLDFNEFDSSLLYLLKHIRYYFDNDEVLTTEQYISNPKLLEKTNVVLWEPPRRKHFNDVMIISSSHNIYLVSRLFDYMLYYMMNDQHVNHHPVMYRHIEFIGLLSKVETVFDKWKDYHITREWLPIKDKL
jgi:hypothetical protein